MDYHSLSDTAWCMYTTWSGELLNIIKVAHLNHMTSLSRSKLTPADGDKSLKHEKLQPYFYGSYTGLC